MSRQPVSAGSVRPRLEELESRRLLSSVPTPDHVVMVIEENQAYAQIIGSSAAPYINSLANQGALFTLSFALEHPSQPNYLDLFSGANQGVTDDNCLSNLLGTANLGSLLGASGKTFGGYSESMPSVGYTGCTSGNYARKHNPWSDFSNVPPADNMPFAGYFPSNYSNLPTVAVVIPNQLNDMHDGTIAMGDTWLQNNLQSYVNWTATHNSLFILTFDEDDDAHGNQIATIFVGPMVNPGRYSEYINHYNVLRTLEDMYGLAYAGQSGSANPITDAWVTAGPPDHFAVTSTVNPAVAGTPFDVTVTAQDVYGNALTGYTGTVAFSSGDPHGATLPGNYRFTAADRGAHTFTAGATLYTSGNWDVTANDSASGATGSANVNVKAGPAVMFNVSAPFSITSGTAFDVTIFAVDPYANIDTNYVGTVSWTSTDGDSRVVLPRNYTFQASDAGQVTYPGGATLITPGNQTITAAAIGTSVTGSATITVASNGPQSGQGSHPDGQAIAGALGTSGPALSPDVVFAPVGIGGVTSSLRSSPVDRFFTAAAEGAGWNRFSGQSAEAPGLVLDSVDDLAPGVLLMDRTLDPLAV